MPVSPCPWRKWKRISQRLGADEQVTSWEITGDLFSTACRGGAGTSRAASCCPPACGSMSGLERTAAVIGNRSHVEIWDAARWDARRAAITNEQRAARLRELHI